MFPGRISGARLYAGTYFMEGTMLLTSGTSAALKDYFSTPYPDQGIKDKQVDRDKDLMVLSTATTTGQKYNFLQQGAGIAGFKSIGKNAAQKEQVVQQFLQYLLEPKVANRLALTSGYLPSTTKALEIYENYISGLYHNEKVDEEGFEHIPEVFGTKKGQYLSLKDNLTQDLLDNFFNPQKISFGKDELNVITTSANPLGSSVRRGIDDYTRSRLFRSPIGFEFEKMLQPGELDRAIKDNLPGTYSNSKIRLHSGDEEI
jgi:hypothetical protein